MTRCISQVTLKRKGGMPRDFITNTMHWEDDSGFSSDGGIGVNGPGLITRIKAFYSSVGQAGFASTLTGEMRIKLYDASQPQTRIPVLVDDSVVPRKTTGTALPAEVAICLSYKAAAISGGIPERRRGRIFLGPLDVSVIATASQRADAFVQPESFQDTVLTAARTLATGGSGAFRLVVFSPTTTPASPIGGPASHDDESYNDVKTFWMDDAFDTVRKRGAAAAFRRQIDVGGTGTLY